MKQIIYYTMALLAFILMPIKSQNCPASHPYPCGGNCYVDAAQAASGGCTNGGGNTDTCNDGKLNGDETDVDCGGSCKPCSTSSGGTISGKFTPTENKTLLIIGQDMGSVNGYKNSGKFPEIGGITQYTNIYDLAGLNSVTNYGGGDMCLQCAINQNPNSTLSIGLWMVEDNDGRGIDHPNGLTELVNGVYDSQIRQLGQFALNNSKTPIFLRIGYEFDGNWNHYDANRYKAAFRYMVDKWRAMGVKNMAYVWQSACWGSDDPNAAPNWYPGDNYVDYIGLSFFFYDTNYNGNNLAYFLNLARNKNKPIMMAEVSAQYYELDQNTYHPYNNPGNPTHMSSEAIWKQYWEDQLLPFVYKNSDVVRVVAYINCDWQSQPQWRWPDAGQGFWGDTRIETNSYIASQWKAEITNGKWLHGSSKLFSKLNGTSNLKSGSLSFNSDFGTSSLKVAIYPNPSADEIEISGMADDDSYTIYSLTGNTIITSNKTKLDISGFANGMYFLKTKNGKVVKFIKE